MKYIVVDEKENDVFTKEFDSKEEAIKYADIDYDRMSESDKAKRKAYYILESVNPDEDAENHFDGNIIKEYK